MRILSFPITFHSLYPSRFLREERTGGKPQAALNLLMWGQPPSAVLAEQSSAVFPLLLHNLSNGSSAYRVAAFANGKAQALLHRHRRDQLDNQADIVARHHHLRARRQLRHSRHVRRAQVKLRTVSLEERRMPPSFFFRQDVDLRLELGVRSDRSTLGQHHAAL